MPKIERIPDSEVPENVSMLLSQARETGDDLVVKVEPQKGTLDDMLNDPDFHSLPYAEKRKVIKQLEPEFDSLPEPEKNKFLSAITNPSLILDEQDEMEWSTVAKEAISNAPESAYNFGKNIYSAFRHPIETAKAVGKLAQGTASLAIPGEQESEKFARAFGSFIVDRYGDMERFKRTLAKDPIGVAADVSTILSGVGGAVSIGGKVAQAKNLSTLANTLKTASKVAKTGAKYTNPMTAVSGTLKGVGGIAENQAKNLVKSAVSFSEKIGYERIDTLTDAILKSGFNVKPSFLKKIDNKLININNKINNILAEKTKAGVKIQTTEITNALDDLIKDPTELQRAGLTFDDIASLEKMKEGILKLNGTEITPETLQAMKVGFNKAFKADLTEKWGMANKKAVDLLRFKARQRLEDIAPQLKKLNENHGALQELDEAIRHRLILYQKKPTIPIKGFVLGTAAGGIMYGGGGNIEQAASVAVTAIILDKIIESPSIQIKLAKAVNAANMVSAKSGKLIEKSPTRTAFQVGRVEQLIHLDAEGNEIADND